MPVTDAETKNEELEVKGATKEKPNVYPPSFVDNVDKAEPPEEIVTMKSEDSPDVEAPEALETEIRQVMPSPIRIIEEDPAQLRDESAV